MRAEMGKDPSRAPPSQLNLPPGFRFYPTDEELVVHYLCRRAASEPFSIPIIGEIELYKFDPWELPERALFGEKEWYFFSPRDRKYPNGSRPNRAAGTGYWKATGTDKPISTMGGSRKVGVKKALVFYRGKAPKGMKTNWIMHEYRLADSASRSEKKKGSLRLDDWVLCRIYKKCSSAQKSPTSKERSEGSCLDTVVSPSDGNLEKFPEVVQFAQRGGGHALYRNGYQPTVDTRMYDAAGVRQSTAHDMSSYNSRKLPELSSYLQQLAGAGREGGGGTPAAQISTVPKLVAVKNEQHGTSSLEVSNPESHVYSSRQTTSSSAAAAEVQQDDDAVESAFNLLRPSFPTEQLNTFTQSLYGLEAGLLPSPSVGGGGQLGSFASLLESDYSAIFSSADDHLQMKQPPTFSRGSPFPRGSQWEPKCSFPTF